MLAGLYTVPSWPPPETVELIGQPTGITLDAFDNPVIFHRGDRIWDGNTFDRYFITKFLIFFVTFKFKHLKADRIFKVAPSKLTTSVVQ